MSGGAAGDAEAEEGGRVETLGVECRCSRLPPLAHHLANCLLHGPVWACKMRKIVACAQVLGVFVSDDPESLAGLNHEVLKLLPAIEAGAVASSPKYS